VREYRPRGTADYSGHDGVKERDSGGVLLLRTRWGQITADAMGPDYCGHDGVGLRRTRWCEKRLATVSATVHVAMRENSGHGGVESGSFRGYEQRTRWGRRNGREVRPQVATTARRPSLHSMAHRFLSSPQLPRRATARRRIFVEVGPTWSSSCLVEFVFVSRVCESGANDEALAKNSGHGGVRVTAHCVSFPDSYRPYLSDSYTTASAVLALSSHSRLLTSTAGRRDESRRHPTVSAVLTSG
jgi:hypothetical protein